MSMIEPPYQDNKLDDIVNLSSSVNPRKSKQQILSEVMVSNRKMTPYLFGNPKDTQTLRASKASTQHRLVE